MKRDERIRRAADYVMRLHRKEGWGVGAAIVEATDEYDLSVDEVHAELMRRRAQRHSVARHESWSWTTHQAVAKPQVTQLGLFDSVAGQQEANGEA